MIDASSAIFSSNTDEWETPDELFDQLNNEFHFDVDVCSDGRNNKLPDHYTKEDDGLSKDWSGKRVWCNPPYSDIKSWVKKAFYETKNDNTLVVMLVPSRTDTKWFHDFVYNRCEIRFMNGRIKFKGGRYNAPFPSMVLVYRGAYT